MYFEKVFYGLNFLNLYLHSTEFGPYPVAEDNIQHISDILVYVYI